MAVVILSLIGLVVVGMGVLVDAWESVAMNVYVPIVLLAILVAAVSRATMLLPHREDYHRVVAVPFKEAQRILTAFMRAQAVDWDTHTTAVRYYRFGRLKSKTTFMHDRLDMSVLMRSRGSRPWTRVCVEDYEDDMEAFVEGLGKAFGD
jgi:hypothetical protein